MAGEIKPLPIPASQGPHEFAKAILEQLTEAFGLTFEQLNGRIVGRVNRFHDGGPINFRPNVDEYVHPGLRALADRQQYVTGKAMEVYRRRYEAIAAIWFLGYNPQMLLEDKRCK